LAKWSTGHALAVSSALGQALRLEFPKPQEEAGAECQVDEAAAWGS